MPEDYLKSRVAFCYAVALAAKKLDKGDFEGLTCDAFLAHIEQLLEMAIADLDDAPAHDARLFLACVRRLLSLHQDQMEASTPTLRLVWSRDSD